MNSYGDGVDRYREVSGLVYRVFMVARDRNSLAAMNCILNELETISELAQGTCKWGTCQYILHTLLVALRPMDADGVLKQMSARNIERFKSAILASQPYGRPNKHDMEKERDLCIKKNKNSKKNFDITSNERNLNSCRRNAAECAMLVSDRWDVVQEELHKWSDILGIPYNTTLVQDAALIQKQKTEPESVPKPQSFVIPDIPKQDLDEKPRRGRPKGSKNTPKEKIVKTFELPIPGQKLKKVSETHKKSNMSKQTDVLIKADGEELWSTQKLVAELGLKNVMAFHTKKYAFLKKYPKYKQDFDRWFGGTVEGKKRTFFRAKYFEKLKNLLAMPAEIKPDETVDSESVAKSKAVETLVCERAPADVVDLKFLETYLQKLHDMCDEARQCHTDAKNQYEDFDAKARKAKQDMENAELRVQELETNIAELTKLQTNLQHAEEEVRRATDVSDGLKRALTDWMYQHGAIPAK